MFKFTIRIFLLQMNRVDYEIENTGIAEKKIIIIKRYIVKYMHAGKSYHYSLFFLNLLRAAGRL